MITLGEALKLENLGKGAAIEKFEFALQAVLDNIMDPNTIATAKREINLRITVKPNAERDDAEIFVECDPKLAKLRPFKTRMFVGRGVNGKAEAHEVHANQADLFPKVKENVTSIAAAGAGKE
jgi:hypothetical protein